jgi:hypothetical protein
MVQQTASEQYYLANKAHLEKELKPLLLPYISTRLYVYFNHGERGKRKRTFYANEHRCTYSQCLKGMVPHIALHKHAGYHGLVRMVESLKGKYISAKLFMRGGDATTFETLCREYYQGALVGDPNDPPFDESEARILYYYVKDGRLVISDTDPAEENFKIEL